MDSYHERNSNVMYRGVRRRSWGKWVSEIREPGTKTRIWLGSYESPEMAARAYDVAAVSLKGKCALPNFPHLIHTLPRPASSDPRDIQQAAAQAAVSFRSVVQPPTLSIHGSCLGFGSELPQEQNYGLEEEIDSKEKTKSHSYEVPMEEFYCGEDFLMTMAEALLLTPPRSYVDCGEDEEYGYSYFVNELSLWSDF